MRESENAHHLDLLAPSCLLLAPAAASLPPTDRPALEPSVRALGELLDELAHGLADRATRQRAADRALEVATTIPGADAPPASPLALTAVGVRLVATDLMVFAGINLEDAWKLCARDSSSSASLRPRRSPDDDLGGSAAP